MAPRRIILCPRFPSRVSVEEETSHTKPAGRGEGGFGEYGELSKYDEFSEYGNLGIEKIVPICAT
jgi:hypothetical protein